MEGVSICSGKHTQVNFIQKTRSTDFSMNAGCWESPPDLKADVTISVATETGGKHSLINN